MAAYMPWYRNAVFYCIDVEKFADGNGDGIGDFIGLADKIGYLHGLGIDCLWLLPFYASPQLDNGYDVSDHYRVDPRFGTFDDFIAFLHKAKSHGMRVITEIVMDHTSDQHPWFQASRYDRTSKYRDYYIWQDTPVLSPDDKPVFPGEVETLWTWDEVGSGFYFHRFYPFQPNLDLTNPAVVDEMKNTMEYWLSFGVDGFRIDALPIMMMPPGEEKKRPERILSEIRELAQRRSPDKLLLAEVNLPPEQMPDYIGDGEHVDMVQNFILRSFILLALVRGEAEPILQGLDSMPSAHDRFQWLSFLSSHDELNLERLRPEHVAEVLQALSPDPATHSYERGIRRRIAPLMADVRRYKMIYSLLFSLPGAPMLIYGDEIGIGDDLSQPGREAVRVLMQWSAEKNGGFSDADARRLVHRPIPSGPFGYRSGVNVASQSKDDDSLLAWFKRLIRLRREAQEIGHGAWRRVGCENDAVLAIKWDWEGRWLLAAHNLTDRTQRAQLDLAEYSGLEYELVFAEGLTAGDAKIDATITLEPYGFAWWRIPYQRR